VNDTALAAVGVHGLVALGHFVLRLGTGNIADITLLKDIEGGNPYADVISELSAGLHFAKKHVGAPKYEELALTVGLSFSQGLFDWVSGSWGPHPEKKDGAVLTLDYNLNIKTEAEFSGALITETTVPPLDAVSKKEVGYLTVRLQPQLFDVSKDTGKLSLVAAKQKFWRTSNFRLQIDGLDCTKVQRIDSFTVKREITVVSSGGGGVTLIPGKVEFPNLRITISEVSAQSWFDWHESFVINGNNTDSFERNGSLSFLSIDLKKELSRIDLHHLGIVRVAPAKGEGSGQIACVTAELYCEEMLLSQGGGS
jgi:hypothetical protein